MEILAADEFLIAQTQLKKDEFKIGNPSVYLWETSKGQGITVQNMDSNHIANALNCLKGNGLTKIPEIHVGISKSNWIRILEAEQYKRSRNNLKPSVWEKKRPY